MRKKIEELSNKLETLKRNLEQVSNSEDISILFKNLQETRTELLRLSQTKEQPEQQKTYIPTLTCKTLVDSGECGLQGVRPTMEDQVVLIDDVNEKFPLLSKHLNRSYYAVYDGHSGDKASLMTKQKLHVNICNHPEFNGGDIFAAVREGLIKTDREICDCILEDGTTVVLVLIVGEDLYVANLGDSEAILGRHLSDSSYEPVVLSSKHKPTDEAERERLTNAGAMVVGGRIFRTLAVSRALGDAQYKRYVINDPYLSKLTLKDTDEFLIIACDGLWDVVDYQKAVDIASEHFAQGKSSQEVSKILANHALNSSSMDNISVVVVSFKWKLL